MGSQKARSTIRCIKTWQTMCQQQTHENRSESAECHKVH